MLDYRSVMSSNPGQQVVSDILRKEYHRVKIVSDVGYHFSDFLRVPIFCVFNTVVRGVWGGCPPVRA